ncbi:NAD(P)H-dependent oxidoreductase [Leucobacter sp. CSA1]|uniref:NAD(P)H-dependent oxidoreductase n=1 Tax=Leucobacter chromiisoli TaxID=2796471 RepID=A0A934Q690_9MICO|nr:NAD(P)H-dependent oxidoreductase [Leucobacter chromiisoli]MBK0419130.1 NAD(P)H-dependent oxidoreductase [Leucobacter chromiisoli]
MSTSNPNPEPTSTGAAGGSSAGSPHGLNAVALTCTLKPSPAPSSSSRIAQQILSELGELGIPGAEIRVVDHDVAPGVETDMGEGDQWPTIRERVMAADILVISTPTWAGRPSSVAQRVVERLDAELSETQADGRPSLFDKVALVAVVGNEDGAHACVAQLFQALDDFGCTIPAQGCTYWNGEAMQKTDYLDLEETPQATASATRTAAANAAHLARLLSDRGYPAPGE